MDCIEERVQYIVKCGKCGCWHGDWQPTPGYAMRQARENGYVRISQEMWLYPKCAHEREEKNASPQ